MKTALIIMALLLAAPCWAVEVKEADGVPEAQELFFLAPRMDLDIAVNTLELEEALALAVKWLSPSPNTTLLYRTPSAELRMEADRMDERDRDVEKIRDVYQRLKTINESQKGQ